MVTILLRTIIIYLILLLALRIMGKRQIGELEVSDLVTTFILSEIATIPMENHQMPIAYAIIPIVTLLTFEIVSSVLAKRILLFKRVVNSVPSVLIFNGRIDQEQMRRTRISLEELLSEIRQNGVTKIEDVSYAILEANGRLTVIPSDSSTPPSRRELGLSPEETGIEHIIVSEGHMCKSTIKLLSLSEEEVAAEIKKKGIEIRDVFLMTCTDAHQYNIIRKEKQT